MDLIDLNRRVESGGAFGYYDWAPVGTLPAEFLDLLPPVLRVDLSARYLTGMANTWIVETKLASGVTADLLFGQESADPSTLPLPKLFDINLQLSGSVDVYGIDVAGMTLTSDALRITIGNQEATYTRNDLTALSQDLQSYGVPQDISDNFATTVEDAMDASKLVESAALEFYNSLKTAALATMNDAASIDLTSYMAVSSTDGASVNIGAMENVIGTNYNDSIAGNGDANILLGGQGSDSLYGGAGNDTIVFDASDTSVLGGDGRDIGYVAGAQGATVDFSTNELEVVVGGAGNDTINMDNGSGGSIGLMAAGGAGDDVFNISCSGGTASDSPAIVWGGEGADSFYISDTRHAAGILVANVANLTADNFADFDMSMLGLGSDFDWSSVSAVVINPDSSDRFYCYDQYSPIGVVNGSYSIDLPGEYYEPQTIPSFDPPDFRDVTKYSVPMNFEAASAYFNGQTDENGNAYSSAVGEFSATFLGSKIGSIQSSTGIIENRFSQALNPSTLQPYASDEDPAGYGFDLGAADTSKILASHLWDGSVPYTLYSNVYYYVDFASSNKPWNYDTPGIRQGVDTLADVGPFTSVNDVSSWFVAGGSFNGLALSADGAISASMPTDSQDVAFSQWLQDAGFDMTADTGSAGSGDGGNGDSGGGSGTNTTPPTNVALGSGSGSTAVNGFDPKKGVVTIDGTPVNPTAPQSGISIAQVGSDVQITFGSGDIVTLASVSLTDWVAAATPEILGSSASETLTGTTAGDLIADGAGNDTIAAGGGDDTIVYGSGDDFIVGKGNVGNPGDDVLDLSRYSSDQVAFSINGENAQIVTPDGTITLEWQARQDIGGASNNIQHVLFSDGSLDEAGIKARALADQSTVGDDVITGTGFDDLIAGSVGNDSISLGSGSDTVVYASGNDSISGGAGDDVLDLSKYSSDQVAFSVSGKDVLVATPDGTITLTFELNKPVGDVNSNIEHVLFSNGSLDEAGIRARAVNDQGTAGNDYVYGTAYDDLINGSAGDDTIAAGGGDDTIVYASGNDFIVGKGNIGNPGDDVLDLSKYSSNQVVFSINGENAQIVTPDGTITLEWQARQDIGGASNNIQHVLFSDGLLDEAGIKARALADQSTAGDDLITGTGFDDMIWGSLGNDSVSAGSGNDTIVYAAGNDSISAGAGQDVLDLSKYTSSQVRFAISGKDIVAATPDGTITLTFEVNKPVGDVTSNIEQILFSDGSLDEAGIRTRAIDDQSTSGNDYIYGSPQNDLIIDGLGNDSIAAGAGNDTIVYDAGNDLIVGKGNIGNPGDDVLDLSKYSSDQVRFSANVDNAKVVTPDGTITLEFQTRNPIGSGANIEHLLFSDGALDEAGIKARAMADQGTAGNDVITGTRQADLIVGGTGNDTMSGSYGADTFAFSVGDGIDSISDFSTTEDLLQFQGLAFSDLTIGQTGSDATIQYGLGDQITLHGVNSASLTQNRFLFA